MASEYNIVPSMLLVFLNKILKLCLIWQNECSRNLDHAFSSLSVRPSCYSDFLNGIFFFIHSSDIACTVHVCFIPMMKSQCQSGCYLVGGVNWCQIHVISCIGLPRSLFGGFFYSVTKILDKLFGQPNKSFEIGTVILCILEMARQEQMLFKY